ncbi:hypothetical protein [Radiobacillus sp. PE A8.2]|uniref:hypothetical protein n=1 Tax=Radiobacillus sp. PE A8.2 TaxID=3380349 RepID=UPI00388E4734
MEFIFELDGLGWAHSKVEVNNQEMEFVASYSGDCLGDFLEALVMLNPLCFLRDKKDMVMNRTFCEWDGEPDGIVWSFELTTNNSLYIVAVAYDDIYEKENAQLIIKTECPYDVFVRTVLVEIDRLIKRQGVIGYREQWGSFDFPLSSFLKLKHYILSKQTYPVEGSPRKELRSNLITDLDLFLKEIN